MPPQNEKSQLKRPRVSAPSSPSPAQSSRHRRPRLTPIFAPFRALAHLFFQGSLPEDATESKKARRSDPLDAEDDGKTPVTHNQQLPTPGVKGDSVNDSNETTATPPGAKTDEDTPRKADEHWSQGGALSSPPQDTQPVSQFTNMGDIHDEFEDDADEGVWGYLQAWDAQYGDRPIVLKKRCACPESDSLEAATAKEPGNANGGTPKAVREEEAYERTKIKGVAAGGYLIGRHPECGKFRYVLSLSVHWY